MLFPNYAVLYIKERHAAVIHTSAHGPISGALEPVPQVPQLQDQSWHGSLILYGHADMHATVSVYFYESHCSLG